MANENSNQDQANFSLLPKQNVLYVELNGSWNHEQTYQYSLEFKKQVSRYFAREWVCILNLQNLDLLISEEDQIHTFKALHTWSYIKGMSALVAVVGIENRHHLLYQFEKIFDDKQPYAKSISYSELEAERWLVDQGKISATLLRSKTA